MPSSDPMIANRSDARLASSASGEPITFTAQNLNTAAQPVVFTTTDAIWGKLLLTATNATTEIVTLSTTSVLSVYLDSLLTDDEIGKITLTSATWSGGPAKDDLGTHLAFSPKASIKLLPSQSVEIDVAGALAAGLPITGYFIFNYSGFSGVTDGESRIQGFRQATPATSAPWPLGMNWAPRAAYQELGNTVYVTPWTGQAGIDNTLVLQIENTQSSPISLPAGSTPRIVVSFVAGSTLLSLCSEDQLKSVDAAVTQSDWPWTVTVDKNGPLPVFVLTPAAGNLDLFNGGGVLAITFSGLVTDLAPGYASPVFVQYAGHPDYEDGYSSVVINKTAPTPYVTQFSVTGVGGAVSANEVAPYGPLIVTWSVFAAQSCNLQGVATVFHPSDSYTFTPGAPYPAPVSCVLQPQIGTVAYYGAQLSFSMSAPPPVQILSFYATTEWPDPVRGSDVYVSWTTTNATSCQVLRLDTGVVIGTALNGDWSMPARGQIPTQFRIIATGVNSNLQRDVTANINSAPEQQ